MRAARARWLLNRLRCMPPAEVGYRLGQAGVGILEKRGWLDPRASMVAAPRQPPRIGPPALAAGEADALLRDADRICAGHVTLFAGRNFDVGVLPQWNRDPATGVLAPAIFAGDIDVGDRAQVGDIKHLWELNRHLQLVRLAQAASISAAPVYLSTLAAQLRGWLEQCPPRVGPNWSSALELGIRLINWSLVWHVLGGDASALFAGAAGQQLRADWLHSIHAHCRHIARHLSRHSSANNHLIGELAGLYVGAVTWPCWRASHRWRASSMAELEQQARLQYSRDGVNREQAFAYHIFSTEFLIVAGLAGEPFSPAYWEGVRRALRFLHSVRDAGGHVPMVGDADDASVLRLGPAGEDSVDRLLQGDSAGARWLLHALPGKRPDMRTDTGWSFPDGGYLLFGARFGQPDEIKGMVDCGPLGYLGITAHGHADALAITLSVAGEECLVDPGTWSYWQAPAWRDYFRGTSAHNTVRVDGVDQSVSGGRFMWLRKAVARIERMPQSPGDFDFRGSHDGYLRLADPVRHLRSVRFHGATLVVRDELAAKKPHLLEQFWHFAPGLALALQAGGVKVRGKRFEVELQVSGDGLTLELVRGVGNPPLGWYSPSYETKQPCSVLKITTLSNVVPVECRITIRFSNDYRS